MRKQQALRATQIGHALINALPEAVGSAERTALWEQRLTDIAETGSDPSPFLSGLVEDLRGLLGAADAGRMCSALSDARGVAPAAPSAGASKRKPRRAGTGKGATAKRGSSKRSTTQSASGKTTGTSSGRRKAGTSKPRSKKTDDA